MINRTLEPQIRFAATKYPIVLVTGPRQAGKTTLIKKCFPDYRYINLEDPNVRSIVEADPKQFINSNSTKVIFDEIQKVPELMSYIQVSSDENGGTGLYILSGSENLLLSEKISQSLAGRVSIYNLLPLTAEELSDSNLAESNALAQAFKGFYPRVYENQLEPTEFFSNYVATYLERDVRQITNVSDLSTFQRFMQLVASRAGQLFNTTSIGNDLGITNKTVTSWLNILEASFVTFRLQPYHKNFGKRIIKSSKVYFYDTGILCYLLGISSHEQLDLHFAKGSVFENLVISEYKKLINNKKQNINTFFWRDSSDKEIDLILDKGSSIEAIEIKASGTYKQEFSKSLDYFAKLDHQTPVKKTVVYTGDFESKSSDIAILNWKLLSDSLSE